MDYLDLPLDMVDEILVRLPIEEQLPFLKNYWIRENLIQYLKDHQYLSGDLTHDLERLIAQNNPLVVKLILRLFPDSGKLIKPGTLIEVMERGVDWVELAEVLIVWGKVDFKVSNPIGVTPLMRAVGLDQIPLVKLILATKEQGYPEEKTLYGGTALMIACWNGYPELVQMLLETGRAHPEYQTNTGLTALMMATREGYSKIVKMLLRTGEAHPELHDEYGKTALMYAREYGHEKIVHLLEQYKK